jgi:predicted ArsR family transcriptional regulator
VAESERREATVDEVRALAHPLRQRILRLCLDEELTNKQLAERLAADPGTVIYHVRKLVATGFLAAGDVRRGVRGALEKPYRATGKSWSIDIGEAGARLATLPLVDALRAEIVEAGDEAPEQIIRLGLTLDEVSREELVERLGHLAEEFKGRKPAGAAKPYGLFLALHRRAWPAVPDDKRRSR